MSRIRYLHQVLSDDPRVLADCLHSTRRGDELLLADEGVQWLVRADELSGRLAELDFPVVLNALETDVAARGLGYTTAFGGLKLLDDIQWVKKVCHFDQVLSWK